MSDLWDFNNVFRKDVTCKIILKLLHFAFLESLCLRKFSRFSLFFKPFFFFLTSFFHQNPVWFFCRFAVPQVDYFLREFSFAKLDFFILQAVLFQRIVQNSRISIFKKEEPLI